MPQFEVHYEVGEQMMVFEDYVAYIEAEDEDEARSMVEDDPYIGASQGPNGNSHSLAGWGEVNVEEVHEND